MKNRNCAADGSPAEQEPPARARSCRGRRIAARNREPPASSSSPRSAPPGIRGELCASTPPPMPGAVRTRCPCAVLAGPVIHSVAARPFGPLVQGRRRRFLIYHGRRSFLSPSLSHFSLFLQIRGALSR